MALLRAAFGHLPPDEPATVILAVSGGPDSLALLALAAEAASDLLTISLAVATVDHGLRPESAVEAEMVADVAAAYELPHATLRWIGEKPSSDIQAAARSARYRLLEEHACEIGAAAILTAHHQDDQIETHLLARRRGAGDRGLAGMRACRELAPGLLLLRPFLKVPGERLKASVAVRDLPAADDPSNRDRRFDRIRLRDAVRSGEIDRDAILSALGRHAEARVREDEAVAHLVADLQRLGRFAIDAWGTATLDRCALAAADPHLAALFFGRLIRAVGGEDHPPARAAIDRFRAAFTAGHAATLGGVTLAGQGRAVLHREFGRHGPSALAASGRHCVFDGRFEIEPPTAGSGFTPGSRIIPFGMLNRGNGIERTLPVLLSAEGAPLAAARPLLSKLRENLPELPCRSRVGFRFMADLPSSLPQRA